MKSALTLILSALILWATIYLDLNFGLSLIIWVGLLLVVAILSNSSESLQKASTIRWFVVIYIWASVVAINLHNHDNQSMFTLTLGGFLTWFWLKHLCPRKLNWGKMSEEEQKVRRKLHYLERQVEYEKERLRDCKKE